LKARRQTPGKLEIRKQKIKKEEREKGNGEDRREAQE
jgi:hypothetical protein